MYFILLRCLHDDLPLLQQLKLTQINQTQQTKASSFRVQVCLWQNWDELRHLVHSVKTLHSNSTDVKSNSPSLALSSAITSALVKIDHQLSEYKCGNIPALRAVFVSPPLMRDSSSLLCRFMSLLSPPVVSSPTRSHGPNRIHTVPLSSHWPLSVSVVVSGPGPVFAGRWLSPVELSPVARSDSARDPRCRQ